MRMSRFEWLAQFFRPKSRAQAERPKTARKPLRRWSLNGTVFEAHTKSEARAMAKKAMGFKDRLPVGVVVREVK